MKIYAIVIFFILLLSVYFITNNYLFAVRQKQADSLDRLHSIAATLALQINGQLLDSLLQKYPSKDDILSTQSEPLYEQIHLQLVEGHQVNRLSSDIYTLVYDSTQQRFEFGITSAPNPYFRHVYNSHPEAFARLYQTGGKVEPFEDEFGTWLSAVAPIKNSQGEVISILSIDRRFNDFKAEARSILWRNIAIAFIATILLSASLYRILKEVLKEEEKAKEVVEKASQLLRKQNKKITSSIQYAQRIQQALMQENESNLRRANNSFHIYYPRDIVSGDFLWTHLDNDCLYVVNADCTGHGVPGALISILGITALNEIIAERKISHPSEILKCLDEQIKYLLHQEATLQTPEGSMLLQDGMDLSLCKIDYTQSKILYAGAHSELVLIHKNSGTTELIKGTRVGIGGTHRNKVKEFETIEKNIAPHDIIHLYTDGFIDQFGGSRQNIEKLKRRRVLNCLQTHIQTPFQEQESIIRNLFQQWKGTERQIDDVSWVSIEI